MLETIRDLVGLEQPLQRVSQALYFACRELDAASVGALHLTCADGSEREAAEAFQQGFVSYMLPPLKVGTRAPFRLCNLGGRYEWGAIRIAHAHFSSSGVDASPDLILAKVNAHVSCSAEPGGAPTSVAGSQAAELGLRFGVWHRYGHDTPTCGALTALLSGSGEPFAADLRETFHSEGRDRVATLLDEGRVPPGLRLLYAALVSARLQARKVTLDVQDYDPGRPTTFVVVPAVTLNRDGRDTEIVCGVYRIETQGSARPVRYTGLGDDPAGYRVRLQQGLIQVSDEHVGAERTGRDHRALAREHWRQRQRELQRAAAKDERLTRLGHDVERNAHRHHGHAKALLRIALPILAEVAPIPAAALLFAEGAAGIHHAFRVHRLAGELATSEDAKPILDEVHARIDQLEPEKAEALIELLAREYRA